MILKTLQFTSEILDQFLTNRFQLEESKVSLNGLADLSGNSPEINSNKIIISFLNAEQETVKPYVQRQLKDTAGQYGKMPNGERYNLNVLFTSNFKDYKEALKYLDSTISFFQMNSVLDAQSYSNLPSGLTKLQVSLENTNFDQMQNIWNSLGIPYQPSLIYKIRIIYNNPEQINEVIPEVSSIKNWIAK